MSNHPNLTYSLSMPMSDVIDNINQVVGEESSKILAQPGDGTNSVSNLASDNRLS